MELKKLTIKGLASIADATIEFDKPPLKDAPIFLLCGDTGSGKTTILDAICLALYAQTPRYVEAQRKDTQVGGFAYNDPLQLIRRGAKESWVALTFRGNDGNDYEAKWQAVFYTRGANKGIPRDIAWEWKDLAPNGLVHTNLKHHLEKEIVPVAVGLTFQQFCRTTLLAQGQFTKFLLASDDDKANILEKLTNTERFSQFGQRIAQEYIEKKSRAEQLANNIANIPGLSAEARAQLEEELKQIAQQSVIMKAQLDELQKQLQWRNELERLVAARDSAQREAAVAQEVLHDEAYLRLATTVAEWDQSQAVHEAVRGCTKAQKDIAAAQQRLAQARTEFAHCRANLAWLKAAVATKQTKLKEIEEYLLAVAPKVKMFEECAVILHALKEAQTAQGNAEAMAKQGESARTTLATLEREAVQAAQARDAAQASCQNKEQEILAAVQARDVINIDELRAKEKLLNERRAQATEGEGAAQRIAEREAEIEEQNKVFAQREQEFAALKKALPEFEQSVAQAKKKRDTARSNAEKQRALIDAGIEKLCSTLHIGDECPVCGNKIEHLTAEASFRELFEKLEAECVAAEGGYVQAANEYNRTVVHSEELTKWLKNEQAKLAAAQVTLTKERENLQALASGLALNDATPEAFAKCAQECGIALCEVEKTHREWSAKVEAVNKLQQERSVLEVALRKREGELATVNNKCAACKERITQCAAGEQAARKYFAAKRDEAAAQIVMEDWEVQWTQAPKEFAAALNAKVSQYKQSLVTKEQLTNELQLAATTIDAVNVVIASIEKNEPMWMNDATPMPHAPGENMAREWNQLSEEVRSAADAEITARNNLAQCENACHDFIAVHPTFTMARLTELMAMEIMPLRQSVARVADAAHAKAELLKAATAALATHQAQCPKNLNADITTTQLAEHYAKHKMAYDELLIKSGKLAEQQHTDDEQAKSRAALEEQLDAAKDEVNEWTALYKNFGDEKGNKMRRVIQIYVLRNVLAYANEYLQALCPDRYQLSCVDMTLTVRDAFEGGIERPAQTLSGGEQFIVSLALALGLSSMHSTGLATGMLFIDEGFGTLSDEHLEQAITTLTKLSDNFGQRKIGIISHVARLKERIATRIEVLRNGRNPSTISVTHHIS